MAVGQQLQCDVCHTVFYAPVVAPDEPGDPTLIDNWPPEMPESDEAAGHEEVTKTVAVPRDVAASPACPLEENPNAKAWSHPPATQPAETPASPAPTEKRETEPSCPSEDSVRSADGSTRPTDDARPQPAPRGKAWAVLAPVASLVLLVASVGIALYVLRTIASSGGDDPNNLDPVAARKSDSNDIAVVWYDASKYAQRLRHVVVKVKHAKYGSVQAKDRKNQVITTDDQNLLSVIVSVRNRSPQSIPFRSWYGDSFVLEAGEEVLAELSDDRHRDYALLRFEDVRSIAGQFTGDVLEPGEKNQDAVVFIIPESVDRKAIKYFRLALPGAAAGATGFYRFQIPTEMIEGF